MAPRAEVVESGRSGCCTQLIICMPTPTRPADMWSPIEQHSDLFSPSTIRHKSETCHHQNQVQGPFCDSQAWLDVSPHRSIIVHDHSDVSLDITD